MEDGFEKMGNTTGIMKKDKVTIQDVARLAGVSMMTVSRVISRKSGVKDTTRRKIQDAIDSLHYQPNISARSLAGNKSYFLGLIYDNPNAAYLSQFLAGALHHCNRNGYNLIISSFESDEHGHYQIDRTLINRARIDGIIIPPPLCDSVEILTSLKDAGIAMVRVAPQSLSGYSPFVCMDDHRAAGEITEYLIDQGHRKIGFILGHPDHGASKLRYEGMKQALEKHNIPLPAPYIQQGYFSYKSGFSCAERLLGLDDPPTAIFASNDDMAAAAISVAHKAGLSVPEDISVAGFDDLPLASTIWPRLTTIRQPIMAMAEKAADFLIYPDNQETGNHILDYKLIIRESVAPPRQPT